MAILSKDLATSVALAWREIETAEELLRKLDEDKTDPTSVDIRDAFGRSQNRLQLGVPSGAGSHRLYDVPFALARVVIHAHIADKRAILAALSEQARIELGADA